MLTSEQVKKHAREMGADIVSIGTMDRFEGAPMQMDPRWMMPTAKSIIAMGFRHTRGVFRGIEEGTFFSSYSAMGYSSINYIEQPYVLHEVGRLLEDAGCDVMPIPNNFPWNNINVTGWVPTEEAEKSNLAKANPPAADRPAPDVFIQLRLAAYAAGLGEIGYSKMFLSKEFGPRQRIAVLLTDAELEPDPVLEPGTLCDNCMACVGACTGKAIPTDKTVKVTIAGKPILADLIWLNTEPPDEETARGIEVTSTIGLRGVPAAMGVVDAYGVTEKDPVAWADLGLVLEGEACTEACVSPLSAVGPTLDVPLGDNERVTAELGWSTDPDGDWTGDLELREGGGWVRVSKKSGEIIRMAAGNDTGGTCHIVAMTIEPEGAKRTFDGMVECSDVMDIDGPLPTQVIVGGDGDNASIGFAFVPVESD